jgi:hypothetical protein
MSSHLDEMALEALAHGRADLLTAEQNAHAGACTECAEAIREARALSLAAGAAFGRVTPEAIDLEELVQAAVAAAPPIPRASRRSILVGGLLAAPLTLLLAVVSLFEGLGVGSLLDGARQAWTVGFTLARLAFLHVTPEIGGTVAAIGVVVVALLSLVMRALVGGATLARPAAMEVVR